MSKELIADCLNWLRRRMADPYELKAADIIEAQQKWIAELEQHAKDADLLYAELETELAAAQAQIKVMRSRLGMIVWSNNSEWQSDAAREILDTPTDDSALREMLVQEREKCAKVADAEILNTGMLMSNPPKSCAASNIADAIRAMEDES